MNTENLTYENLSQFHGSEALYFHPLFRAVKYTEGCKFLNNNGAGWLIDALLSHLCLTTKVQREEFVCATLIVRKNRKATLTFTDGGENVLARQQIEYTDFPIIGIEIKFFRVNNVLMLASEY